MIHIELLKSRMSADHKIYLRFNEQLDKNIHRKWLLFQKLLA